MRYHEAVKAVERQAFRPLAIFDINGNQDFDVMALAAAKHAEKQGVIHIVAIVK